jgi:hypothetical protein
MNFNLLLYFMNPDLVQEAINKLFINTSDNYIFIYTPPKVGSTTLVTSLRVSLGKSYNIIHIHDEIMLSVLTGITNVKINDIIHFLSNKGKNVYVIDVYRTPIERKMSEYFEKLSPYHFNNSEDNVSKYSMKRIIDRFNKLFPHLENGDHYFEQYNIGEPIAFDFDKKYSLQEINNVKYIKLRLCDSELWASILSNILRTDIIIIYDYNTEQKSIGDLYKRFKNEYKLPSNYIELIKSCKYFNFYYNETERNNYIEMWSQRLGDYFTPYTATEYNFYMILCLENQYINDIQIDHYIDNGCFCKYCINKRKDIFFRAKAGEKHFEKIIHTEVMNEVKTEKIKEIGAKIKTFINNEMSKKKFRPKQFKINVTNT